MLSNTDYNKYNKDINLNKIAILHNRVLLSLTKEPNYDYVVDQFAKPFIYYNYLR